MKNEYIGKDLEAMLVADNYYNWIIEEFKRYFGKNVAEVGAGSGNFTSKAIAHVNHLIAFEPSQNMYNKLRNRFSQNQKIEIINSVLRCNWRQFEGSFDSIIYNNVLEHIENDEQELNYVNKTLVWGGYVLILVPALSFLYTDFDKKIGHFRRYHKKDFERLSRKTGFKIKKIKYMDLVGILPWCIFFGLLKKQLTTKNVLIYDRFFIPAIKNIEGLFSPPVGKNLLVVMQKTDK